MKQLSYWCGFTLTIHVHSTNIYHKYGFPLTWISSHWPGIDLVWNNIIIYMSMKQMVYCICQLEYKTEMNMFYVIQQWYVWCSSSVDISTLTFYPFLYLYLWHNLENTFGSLLKIIRWQAWLFKWSKYCWLIDTVLENMFKPTTDSTDSVMLTPRFPPKSTVQYLLVVRYRGSPWTPL